MGVLSVEVGGLAWTGESLYYEGLVWILTITTIEQIQNEKGGKI